MAIATSNLVYDNSTLANFKAWAQFIFNGFNTTAGWTQTSDTGQTAPSVAGSVGTFYFIFKMSDTLQATAPAFVKITYGTNSTTVRFTVQLGTSTDGAGNLGGLTTNISLNSNTTNQGATTFPSYVSGDSSSIRFMLWQSATVNTCMVFGVERSKDSSGNNTGDYLSFISAESNTANGGNSQPWNLQWVLTGVGVTFNFQNGSWFVPFLPASLNFNGTTAVASIIPLVGHPGNPMFDWQVAYYGDAAEGATAITVSLYGANHNFACTKQNNLSRTAGGFSNTAAILMRYE